MGGMVGAWGTVRGNGRCGGVSAMCLVPVMFSVGCGAMCAAVHHVSAPRNAAVATGREGGIESHV